MKKVKYNNGVIEKMFIPGTEPEGFVLGGKKLTPEQKEQLKIKQKAALVAKYGSLENYYKIQKEKADQTIIAKYGTRENFEKYSLQKRRSTCLERYGVDSNFKNPTSIEKRKQTWIEKYGTDHPNRSSIVQDHRRQTCLHKYGVDAVSKTPEFKEKVKEGIIAKYGSLEAYETVQLEKRIRYNQEHYGVDHFFQSNTFKEKTKQKLIEKYGSIELARASIHEKYLTTMIEKYGVDNFFKSSQFKEIMTEDKKLKRLQDSIATKRRNGTFNTSKGEIVAYNYLVNIFGEDDVVQSYQDPRYSRMSDSYKFKCDFYIKSKDLFIELNLHPTHWTHVFDANNEEDVILLEQLISSESEWDQNVALVWGKLDVEKLTAAKINNLNYRMVYSIDELKQRI